MKKIIFIFTMIASLFCVASVNAQELTMRQYKFTDNWFTSVNVGATYSLFDGATDSKFLDLITPTASIGIGKWVTPSLGARIQGEWGQNKTLNPTINGWDKTTFNHVGVFADGLFNLHNILGNYKEDRVFELVALAGVGYVHGFGKDGIPTTDNLALRGGLQFNFRLNDALKLNIEPTITALDDNFNGIVNETKYDAYVNLTVGLVYRFKNWDGNRGFKLIKSYDEAYVKRLNDEINRQRELANDQSDLIKEQKKFIVTQSEELAKAKACCEAKTKEVQENVGINSIVSFKIGKSKVDKVQEVNVFKAAQILKEHKDLKVCVSGFADAKTGSKERNKVLSEERAQAVKNLLINKYGIDSERITIVANGSESQVFDENDWNRVVIFMTK